MRATSVLSSLGYSGLRAVGFPALARRIRGGGAILCYHNVVRERHNPRLGGDPALHLPVDDLEAQVSWLARQYSVIPLREMVTRIEAGRSLRGTAALTFDDGYRGVGELAIPVLRRLRLPATMFIVAGAAGTDLPFWWDHPAVVARIDDRRRGHWLRTLGGDRARILAAVGANGERPPTPFLPAGWASLLAASTQGIDLGAHSFNHHTLTALTDEELAADLVACREEIARRTGLVPEILAYPYGIWDARVRAAARRAGYRAAVTLDRGVNTPKTDPWSLRRVNIPAGIGLAAYECWVAGVRP
jgi:peptidoglycan/xylan/chitin deacetylase (PgdA/CDA1 family)